MLAAVVVLAAAVTAVVVLVDRSVRRVPSPERSEEPLGLEHEHARLLEYARRRIAADNRGGVRETPVQAAPIAADSRLADPFAAPAPAPPDGFSFTSAPTKMAMAAYANALPSSGESTRSTLSSTRSTLPSTRDDTLDWLFANGDARAAPLAAVADLARQMQRDWVFGWLRLADDAQVEDARAAAAPLGVDVLAASGLVASGRLLRARLPADETRLAAVARLSSVSGLGVVPPERKAHEAFRAEVHAAPFRQLPVLITLMAHDQDGRWRRALQARGVEVGRFDGDIRAYAANVDAATLDAALQADFVLAVEPMGMVRAAHDSAVPAMGADAVRFHEDAPGLFRGTGGAAVPIGVVDTGLNVNHLDIASHRSSICGANFVTTDHRAEDADLWVDEDGHGTHVTGTIAGNGFAKARYAGMAPSVAHIRFAKVLNRNAFGLSEGILRGMDYLAGASACGSEAVAVKPLIVNMSLAATSRRWHGRTAGERKLDAVVWAHRQLYVVANANASISGFANYGAAKNSLSVGAVHDNGHLASFSSWGPTFDGRLAPQIVAIGADVYSARGQGSRGGYISLSGTSMASPAAAGVAALLLDAVPGFREQPALTRARLMASAIKPDAWLDAEGAFPANNSAGPGVLQAQFGLGKASARTSVLQRQRADGWENGAATSTMTAGGYGYHDIVVPEGASRLDLVLAWDEPPTDTIGSTVLNDLDLWLDQDADCGTAACGEYASVSRRDNVEWIIVKNPAAGTYRARVVPSRVYTAAPRAGLAWTIIRGASTPALRLAVDESRPVADGQYRIALSLSVDAYVAAGVQVAAHGCRAADGTECSPAVRVLPARGEDGVEQSSPEQRRDDHTLVGEVGVGEQQRVEFDVDLGSNQQPVRLYFVANAWNATSAVASVAFAAAADPDLRPPDQAAPPANDHFANAATLAGASGSVTVDLLAATFEPGEPTLGEDWEDDLSPFVSSIWFQWTAPTQGATHFDTSGAHVSVLQGERIAALTEIAANKWSASFFARRGQTYRVRVGCGVYDRDCAAQTLRWSQGQRPANDDFAAAVELLDAAGEIAGDNSGATLEPGERIGGGAATVWYRWTAPEDGAWVFTPDDWASSVLIFTGDHIAALRLVSGSLWRGHGSLRARAGTEYRIAVAARDAFGRERAFTLKWYKYERRADAEDFAHAHELEGATGSERISVGDSVEPGEPRQTGVRTRWWVWTAPSSGRFAWHLADTSFTEIKVAVFAPADAATSSLATLQLLADTGPEVTGTELAFDAVSDQRYWLSVGLHTGDDAAFKWADSATLRWGEAPANDSLAQAIALAGGSGATTFVNRFGTLDPGERNGILGDSSLWWSFTPAKAGWYRFWLDGTTSATLAVYRVRSSGLDDLRLVARSHGDWQAPGADDAIATVFDAAAEQRYLIRAGQRGDRSDAEATLHWEQTDAPTWLRYAGRLPVAALGLPPGTEVRTYETYIAPPSLAFEDRGAVLYLATSQGIHILARDAANGALTPTQVVAMEEPKALLWDHNRSKLYALIGCSWRQLAPGKDSRSTLKDEGALKFTGGDPLHCHVRAAFLDSAGAFLHHSHVAGIGVYAFGDTGLTVVQELEIKGFQHAVSSRAGTRVYATDGNSLLVFTRDEDTGALRAAGEVDLAIDAVAIAISDDDAYLVALATDGATDAYELSADAVLPQRRNTLGAFGNATWRDPHGNCRVIAARNGLAAVDGFCRNSAFSAAIRVADGDGETAMLKATDYMANWQADRFNNYIPEFKSEALAASPDGRHVYVYSEGDILIFERIGNPPPAESADMTLRDAVPSADQISWANGE